MRRKTLSWIVGIVFIFLAVYISIGVWISKDVEHIVENGMMNDLSYEKYMSESVYLKMNPAKRGMTNYELHYNPGNHSYKPRLPLHLFFIAWGTINNRYEDCSMGFNENIFLKLKLKGGKWVASDVSIKP